MITWWMTIGECEWVCQNISISDPLLYAMMIFFKKISNKSYLKEKKSKFSH